MTGFVRQVASDHGTMFEFTELLRATHSFNNGFKHVAVKVIGTSVQ